VIRTNVTRMLAQTGFTPAVKPDCTSRQKAWHRCLPWLACAAAAMVMAPAQAQTASETVLHSFASPPRGAAPFPGVIGDSGGNLYVVYKLEMAGNETVLIQLRKFHAKSRPSAT